MPVADIIDFILRHRAPALDIAVIADLFDRLMWILDDNGAEIDKVRRAWLEQEEDLTRVQVALTMEEAFPYETRQQMEQRFTSLVNKWPALRPRCDAILSDWDRQFER